MAQTLTVAGAASCPFVDGGTVAPINLASALGFTSRADFQRSYAGAIIVNETNGRFFETAAGRTGLLAARWRQPF